MQLRRERIRRIRWHKFRMQGHYAGRCICGDSLLPHVRLCTMGMWGEGLR